MNGLRFPVLWQWFYGPKLAKWALQLHTALNHIINQVLKEFTLILCDLTRCMFNAGVLGRIFPHPSTVQRMLVLTSLVSSVMVGFIISRDCDRDTSWHFGLSVAALPLFFALPITEAAMFLCWQSILYKPQRQQHWINDGKTSLSFAWKAVSLASKRR